MIRTGMSGIRLEAGDVLLILGPLDHVRALRADRDVLILEWSMTGLPAPRNAVSAGLIFIAVVVAAASGLAPIHIAALYVPWARAVLHTEPVSFAFWSALLVVAFSETVASEAYKLWRRAARRRSAAST